jgi:hypothetical protein
MTTMAMMTPAVATTAGRSTAAITSRSTAAITRATRAAMATVAGHSHFLTAHQGDADDREKNRDAKHKHTIHPSNPPNLGSGT